jgi:chromosome segregation ATPase
MDFIIFILSIMSIGLICSVYWVLSNRINDISFEIDRLKTVISGVATLQKQQIASNQQKQYNFNIPRTLPKIQEDEIEEDETSGEDDDSSDDDSSDDESSDDEYVTTKPTFVFPSSKEEALIVDNELMELCSVNEEPLEEVEEPLEEVEEPLEEVEEPLEEVEEPLGEVEEPLGEVEEPLEEVEEPLGEVEEPLEEVEEPLGEVEEVSIDNMNFIELKKYAVSLGIKVSNKTKKSELIEIIRNKND